MIINIARDFSRFPAGRYVSDGPYSGEAFRNDHLLPALKDAHKVIVELDGARGYGSSFLEEAFGGAVRTKLIAPEKFAALEIISKSDPALEAVVKQFIVKALNAGSANSK